MISFSFGKGSIPHNAYNLSKPAEIEEKISRLSISRPFSSNLNTNNSGHIISVRKCSILAWLPRLQLKLTHFYYFTEICSKCSREAISSLNEMPGLGAKGTFIFLLVLSILLCTKWLFPFLFSLQFSYLKEIHAYCQKTCNFFSIVYQIESYYYFQWF